MEACSFCETIFGHSIGCPVGAPDWLQQVAEELTLICIEEVRDGEQTLAFKRAMKAREILHANGVECIHEPETRKA